MYEIQHPGEDAIGVEYDCFAYYGSNLLCDQYPGISSG